MVPRSCSFEFKLSYIPLNHCAPRCILTYNLNLYCTVHVLAASVGSQYLVGIRNDSGGWAEYKTLKKANSEGTREGYPRDVNR